MYKLAFFVPEKEKETVKEALFSIGVGRYNNYDRCSWEVLGTGQFRPLNGANPHIGNIGEIETVEEYKVEMICSDELIHKAIEKLKDTHPYEEVAYEIFKLEEF
ncbi:MAG: NGG1p interacting factor NIF3 [Epsilonproteobacteria bacterium]|nr:NGG1p interacting factor NIF3 [Campylobacterota bacterium]